MSWYEYIPLYQTCQSTYQTLTSWVTWIIVAIIVIIIFWLFWGGRNHDFVGLKPLMPGVRPSEVMDPNTMTILGINDQTVLNPILPEEDTEANFIDLSQLVPETGKRNESSEQILSCESIVPSIRMVSSRQIRENQLESGSPLVSSSGVQIYLPSPNRPAPGETPKFKDLDLGTAQDRRSAAESRGERVCRQFLEKYYHMKFPRIRPDFLVNPVSGRNLELDGYNPDLNIGFEYNGYQHYTFPNRFHRTEHEFNQQVRRDEYKREACDLAGVYLIIIPYTVPHQHIPEFIKQKLKILETRSIVCQND